MKTFQLLCEQTKKKKKRTKDMKEGSWEQSIPARRRNGIRRWPIHRLLNNQIEGRLGSFYWKFGSNGKKFLNRKKREKMIDMMDGLDRI